MKDEAYLVTTPMGGIVLGGGLSALIREGKCKPEDSFGQIDDSGESVDPNITECKSFFSLAADRDVC
jgi:hypothetical protein